MPKQTWFVAIALSACVAFALLGLSAWHRGLELGQTRLELKQLQTRVQEEQTKLAHAQSALTNAMAQVHALRTQSEETLRSQASMEDAMRKAIASKDVTISELQGKLTVTILDRILFDSGEAALKPEGETVLRQIAGILSEFPNRQIHVVGHTDNVPIRASALSRYASNWELSMARATAAVRFLTEKAGVDPRRLGALGYGEYRPIADNTTPEGRAHNRRIAIVVLSDELAGVDLAPPPAVTPSASPTTPTSTSTNSPPTTNAPPPTADDEPSTNPPQEPIPPAP
ncbi:MAG TPA: OmpA family protein [Verrucomicrobiota bacterium]|nr:OmpA family protein [Verrucomicrobiota bacterium]HNU50864.1 OmpA family protein [Verrucomicrobiota bacterium]